MEESLVVFDWIQFLNDNDIEYVTKGPNVAYGHLNIKCPWCGASDPSHHLGINLKTGAFGCWRSKVHRGYKAHRLIQQLLDCSYQEAIRIVGKKRVTRIDDFSLDNVFELLGDEKSVNGGNGSLSFPSDFNRITLKRSTKRFFDYLIGRGFHKQDVSSLCTKYHLRCALLGAWKYRVIVPVFIDGKLVNWTARAISNSIVKYKTLSDKQELADRQNGLVAPVNLKEIIFNYDLIRRGGDILIVCEGPFDALKIDFYGKRDGIRATCLFGATLTKSQILFLA